MLMQFVLAIAKQWIMNNSCKILIGMHKMHGQEVLLTIFVGPWLPFIVSYPMMTYTHPIADSYLPIKDLVAM